MNDPQVTHCVETIRRIVRREVPSRRDLLQLGYNLGRLSERTGLGREPFWDRWKAGVEAWDQPALIGLSDQLGDLIPPAGIVENAQHGEGPEISP